MPAQGRLQIPHLAWGQEPALCGALSLLSGPRPGGPLMPSVINTVTLCLPTDDSGDDDEETATPTDKSELHNTIKNLSLKLDDLSTCNDLIAKHGAALQRSLNELDSLRIPYESSEKLKAVNERATLFRITSNAMINVSAARHQHPREAGVPDRPGLRFGWLRALPQSQPSPTLSPSHLSSRPCRRRWARTFFLIVWWTPGLGMESG